MKHALNLAPVARTVGGQRLYVYLGVDAATKMILVECRESYMDPGINIPNVQSRDEGWYLDT